MNGRRRLVLALGSAALTAPLSPLAQQSAKTYRVGFLSSEAADPDTLVKYRGELAGKTYLFTFTITKAGKIYSVGQREE